MVMVAPSKRCLSKIAWAFRKYFSIICVDVSYFDKQLILLIKGIGGILKGINPPYSQNSSYILYRVYQVEPYLNSELLQLSLKSESDMIRPKITIFDITPNSISLPNDSYTDESSTLKPLLLVALESNQLFQELVISPSSTTKRRTSSWSQRNRW